MEKKLEVKDLVISFRTQGGKVQAVRNISFDLYKGETLAIVGESGSGKSVTNRAVIGILANNAIVEGGQIIYEGQDLLKIDEEHFHKLRGDKIAMIFQDPMSSLNPIMRVGKQLTEAMILKGKVSQRENRKEFNKRLALLLDAMNKSCEGEVNAEELKKQNAEMIKTFDTFCIESCHLESDFNKAYNSAFELKTEIEELLFMVEKRQKIDVKKSLSVIFNLAEKAKHTYVVNESQAFDNAIYTLKITKSGAKGAHLPEVCKPDLLTLKSVAEQALAKTKPNFFTLGYYKMFGGSADLSTMTVEQITAETRKYLDDNFMLNFIEKSKMGIEFNAEKTLELKKEVVEKAQEFRAYFEQETLDKKTAYAKAKEFIAIQRNAINKLDIIKNGMEYTFESSIYSWLDKYFAGVKNNPKELARYEKQSAKHQKLTEKGKTPDWKVVPAAIVDLELVKKNIVGIIDNLCAVLNNAINAEKVDSGKVMVAFIDDLKEKASAVVYKVTRRMAKAKALKLLEEVGIPEPAIRYKQYPFEFSGGMRQRIVIAIALAANPDILICDEPTTALDVTIQSQILELINKLKAERNLSVIFITHDLGVVANMADRIAVMYAGKIVEYGTAEDVFYDPRHPYTWALLSSMPDLDTKEKLEAIPGTPPNMIFPPKGDAFAARNKYAMQIDYELEPPMFAISETHSAATWLLHPDAPKVETPKIIVDRVARMKKREEADNE